MREAGRQIGRKGGREGGLALDAQSDANAHLPRRVFLNMGVQVTSLGFDMKVTSLDNTNPPHLPRRVFSDVGTYPTKLSRRVFQCD